MNRRTEPIVNYSIYSNLEFSEKIEKAYGNRRLVEKAKGRTLSKSQFLKDAVAFWLEKKDSQPVTRSRKKNVKEPELNELYDAFITTYLASLNNQNYLIQNFIKLLPKSAKKNKFVAEVRELFADNYAAIEVCKTKAGRTKFKEFMNLKVATT